MSVEKSEDQLIAEFEQIKQIVESAVAQYKPADISTEKLIARMMGAAQMFGITRSSVIGCLIYAAMYSTVVGVDINSISALQQQIVDGLKDLPQIKEMAESYAAKNAEFHANQAKTTELADGSLGVMLPSDGKVH